MADDLISRQEALKGFAEHSDGWCYINALPASEPERQQGEWIGQNPMVDTEECSECGYNIIDEELETPFCPWCGADMRGREYPCYSPPDGSQLFTNADRIRAMTDEELAEYLYDRGNGCEYCYGICAYQHECNDFHSQEFCIEQIVKWLNQDYKGE